MNSPIRREQHSIRRPFAQKHSAIPNSQSHVTYGHSFKTRAWLLAYHFSTLQGCTLCICSKPSVGSTSFTTFRGTDMLRPAKLVDSRLSRPEPGGCSCEMVRLSDCFDLVQVVGGRKKSGLGKYGRRETLHILEALLAPEIKQHVFRLTPVQKHLNLKFNT